MADMNFGDDSTLTFEVQWFGDSKSGQPKLVCTNPDAPADRNLGVGETATDTSSTDVREQATVTVTVTAEKTAFSECNVYDYNGQPPPWDNNQKTITLGIGEEDNEITFTVAVDTKYPTTSAAIEEGWVPTTKGDTTTWVLDPYVRLTRTGYHIKAT